MRHLAYFACLLSTLTLHNAQSVLVDPYYGLPPTQQEIAHLLQQHTGNINPPASYSYQSQTIVHPNPQLATFATQYAAATNFNNHNTAAAAAAYDRRSAATPTTPSPPQLWSAAPIVVDYDGGDDYVEELLRLRPQQVNSAQSAPRLTPFPYLQPPIVAGNLQTRTSSPPHYFEGYSRSPTGLFKQPPLQPQPPMSASSRPVQTPPSASYYQRARALFSSTDARDSSALSSLEAQNTLLSALHIPDYTSEFAPHFERYVGKNPRRLLPKYEFGDDSQKK